MKIRTPRASRSWLAVAAGVALFAPSLGFADDDEMIKFPARILKVESLKHEGSPTGNRVAGAFGLLGGLFYNASLQSTWYRLNNPEGEEIGIESSGGFSEGQCVLVFVKKENVENSKLFPGVSRVEAFEGCAK